jgi:hypothetical protein
MTARKSLLAWSAIIFALAPFLAAISWAQGLGGAGSVKGVVKDPNGGVMVAVTVTISNSVTGFTKTVSTEKDGTFQFLNLAPNPYHLKATTEGFQTLDKDVDVHGGVPVALELTMALGAQSTSVEVVSQGVLAETDPTMHVDLDLNIIQKTPVETGAGLNAIVTSASPGIAADANGFFHPMGDHAQTQYSVDNQPVTDQQSKIYSNQLPPEAVQSLEVMNGVAPAEFGDKSSLVVRVLTKSGVDQPLNGSVTAGYGSFTSPSGGFSLGGGDRTFGNFATISGLSTNRYLDTPEFQVLHDNGSDVSFFDRLDQKVAPNANFTLDAHVGHSSFQAPNSFDAGCVPTCFEPGATGPADQNQTISSYNVAPGYSWVVNNNTLLTANAYVRGDHVIYTPSTNPFNDVTASVGQNRRLTNIGGKVDLTTTQGKQELKAGAQVSVTPLTEAFTLGITDPGANSPCVNASGIPVTDTTLTNPSQCAAAGFQPSTNTTNITTVGFLPGLEPFDLTRGGSELNFNGTATIKEEAAYVEDTIKTNTTTLSLGVRLDNYDGLAKATQVDPRVGFTYAPRKSTVFRASYGRFLETPYNENLILSSATGVGNLANILGSQQVPLAPGKRNHIDVGGQQAFGGWLLVDVGYFWKFTTGAYDFDNILSTPIAFPIEWDKSRLSGLSARANLVEHHGFSLSTNIGHNKARYFYPETGGLLQTLTSTPPTLANGEVIDVFRIDHDQVFQQDTTAEQRFARSHGGWATLSWRYDSGLVSGSGSGIAESTLALDGDQQSAIGLSCNGVAATLTSPITSCPVNELSATRIRIVPFADYNPDTNPPRIVPRNVFDLAVGFDNLTGTTGHDKISLRFTVVNLANTESLYNFLSTFSGTHFMTPRTYAVQLGVGF